jgi:AraC family transcriptional regulator
MAEFLEQDRIFLHSAYTLHYRRTGRGVVSGEARPEYSLWLAANRAVLLNPHENASLEFSADELLALTLTPAFVLDCAARAGFANARGLVAWRAQLVEDDERLARLARDLTEELTQGGAGHEAFIAALMEQLTLHLLRRYANVKRAPDVELSRVGLIDRRIRRAVELMQARLGEDLSLDEMAAAAYLSPFHFARLFKKLTGATPHSYLAGLRASEAQKLLARNDLSVTQIAARVGYASPSHFTKAFRQATGLTPREFRAALVARA